MSAAAMTSSPKISATPQSPCWTFARVRAVQIAIEIAGANPALNRVAMDAELARKALLLVPCSR
jgi:hypothetical protein